ncbi:MAG: HDIG domain-containing protein [Bacteroidetes bacterium]|nr:HDIG domain-containing protein [Bacteroidota bacterium]
MGKLLNFFRNKYQDIYKTALFLSAIVILVLVFPREGKFKYEFSRNKPWLHEDFFAPFDFSILKPEEQIKAEQVEALRQTKPYFILDTTIFPRIRADFHKAFNRAWIERYGDTTVKIQSHDRNLEKAELFLNRLYNKGIYDPAFVFDPVTKPANVILIRGNIAKETNPDSILTIHKANDLINRWLRPGTTFDHELLSVLLFDHLQHNVLFDEIKTVNEREKILAEISPTRGMVLSGEKIISRGDLVTTEKYQVLISLKKYYEEQLGAGGAYYFILAGQIILISIAMGAMAMFLYYFRKDVFRDNKKVLLILVILLLLVFITSLVVTYHPAYLYLVPLCLVPILVRAFFDTRMALYVHLITVIITGFLVPNSFEFLFLQMMAGISAILTVANLQRRSQFFLTSVSIFFTYSVLYSGLNLIQEGSLREIAPLNFAFFAGNSVLTLFAYPLIYIFEKLFGLITDVTLIELSNTNNPLLRELSLKAPGTFQHSLQVANLSEEAVFEVGGNALLVRTGALYHDIGKMDMPVYFIENQTTGVNPHDELTYEESARIIIGHVIKGIEKAKKHKLPEQIIDFIRTHHGTRKVEYFYIMQKKEFPDQEIDERDFTYHGPIPFSKETAILMMADSVEAASRSLKSYDSDSINALVDNIIDKQLETGQFDNSNITLKEITRIKKIFKKKLMTIYHIRIEYPR